MGHYLLNYLFTTVGMVALLYALYGYIRQRAGNPSLGGFRAASQDTRLTVESVMTLEPRKRLYVVRCEHQRFLIATTMDRTELLASLDTTPESSEMASNPCPEAVQRSTLAGPLSVSGSAGAWARFRESLRWVLQDRLPSWAPRGGK